MPQIPAEYIPTVQPGQPIEGRIAPNNIDRASPENFGGQVGQALSQGGNELAENALKMQNLRNETAASQADADFTRKLVDLQWNPAVDPATGQPIGFNNRMGKTAVDSYKDSQDQVMAARDAALGGLENDVQRRMAAPVFQRRLAYTLESMSAHAGQQNRVWSNSVLDDRAKATIDTMLADSLNDKTWQQGINTIKDISSQRADLEGTGPDGTNAHAREYMDSAWKGRIEQLALSNPVLANQLMTKGIQSGQISGLQTGQLQQHLKGPLQAMDVGNFVNSLVRGGAAPPQGLEGAIVGSESAGHDYMPDGVTPLTSVKGAKYKYQVIDSTAVDPGFGIKGISAVGAPDDNAENRNRIGHELLGKLTLKYGGDPTLIAAAYNAGSDRVDKLLKSFGDPRTGAVGYDAWIDKLPVSEDNDTPAYVRGVLKRMGQSTPVPGNNGVQETDEELRAKYNSTFGEAVPQQQGDRVVPAPSLTPPYKDGGHMVQPAPPPPGQMTKDDYAAALPKWEQAIEAKYADNPSVMYMALGKLHSFVSGQIADLDKQSGADVRFIQRQMLRDGGPTDQASWFAENPQNATVWARLNESNPAALEGLNRWFVQNATGKPVEDNPGRNDHFMQLRAEAFDPDRREQFAQRNLAYEKGYVSDKHLNELDQWQTAILAHDASMEGKSELLSSSMKKVQGQLQIAGVYNPKAGPEKQPSAYYDFQTKLSQWLDNYQAEKKHPPTPLEEKTQATELLRSVTVPGKIWDSQVNAFKLKPGEETKAQMPKEQIPEFTNQFIKFYGRTPFPGELDQLYFTHLLHPGDAAALQAVSAKIMANSHDPSKYLGINPPTSTPQATPAVAKTPAPAAPAPAAPTPEPVAEPELTPPPSARQAPSLGLPKGF